MAVHGNFSRFHFPALQQVKLMLADVLLCVTARVRLAIKNRFVWDFNAWYNKSSCLYAMYAFNKCELFRLAFVVGVITPSASAWSTARSRQQVTGRCLLSYRHTNLQKIKIWALLARLLHCESRDCFQSPQCFQSNSELFNPNFHISLFFLLSLAWFLMSGKYSQILSFHSAVASKSLISFKSFFIPSSFHIQAMPQLPHSPSTLSKYHTLLQHTKNSLFKCEAMAKHITPSFTRKQLKLCHGVRCCLFKRENGIKSAFS